MSNKETYTVTQILKWLRHWEESDCGSDTTVVTMMLEDLEGSKGGCLT